MILGDSKPTAATDSQTTLDDMFRRHAARRPHAIALVDPPNRSNFTSGAPRRLSYAEADRLVDGIASRLHKLGLPPDTVIGIFLPNTVEIVLTILGVLRAGMIAAPMPLLWRRADTREALGRIGAKVIVTASRIGDLDAGDLAMRVAADLFPIRYVCAFGGGRPDGAVPMDDLMSAAGAEDLRPTERGRDPALHVALVTWDVTPEGPVAVARNHAELIAGGLGTLIESGIEPGEVILGACAASSFAGVALTVVRWLLTGGTLCLHHGFDAASFAAQGRDERCNAIVVPGAAVPRLAAAGLLTHADLRNILAVWRAPERMLAAAPMKETPQALIDVAVFGEAALVAMRRSDSGCPAPIPLRSMCAPPGSPQPAAAIEIARTAGGTLALRGPMVPRHPFPPGGERLGHPEWRANATGFVDTGYACRQSREGAHVLVTAPPPGMVSIGGHRLVLRQMEELVRRVSGDATIAALPNALSGLRLAGAGADMAGARAELLALGAHALVTEAFHDRPRSGLSRTG